MIAREYWIVDPTSKSIKVLSPYHNALYTRQTVSGTDEVTSPLLEASFVAEAALRVLQDEESGRAWVVQPNRVEPFRFPGVPGPR